MSYEGPQLGEKRSGHLVLRKMIAAARHCKSGVGQAAAIRTAAEKREPKRFDTPLRITLRAPVGTVAR